MVGVLLPGPGAPPRLAATESRLPGEGRSPEATATIVDDDEEEAEATHLSSSRSGSDFWVVIAYDI